jgi:hypothetical protein
LGGIPLLWRKRSPLGGIPLLWEKKISPKGRGKSRERLFSLPDENFRKTAPPYLGGISVKYPRFWETDPPLAEGQKTRASFVFPAYWDFSKNTPLLGGYFAKYPFFLRNRALLFLCGYHTRTSSQHEEPCCACAGLNTPNSRTDIQSSWRSPVPRANIPPSFRPCFQRNSPTLGVVAVLAVRVKRCCGA